MYKLTIDIFREAAERFATVETEVLPNWLHACNCPDPGMQVKCRTCPYYKKLGLLVQQQIDPVAEKGFAAILPPEHEDPYSKDVKQKSIAMYALGYTVEEIQQLNGVPSRRILRNWLRESSLPKRSFKYSKEQKQACIDMYTSGWTPREIENQVGVPADTVTDWVYSAGVARSHKYSEEFKQKCIELYRNKTAKEVSEITGVSVCTIKSWGAKAGIGREQKHYSKAIIEECLTLYREGKSPKEITNITKILPSTIRSWIRKAGISRGSQPVADYALLTDGEASEVVKFSCKRKPGGYWQDFNNLKRELISFNENRGQIGLMPTARELGVMGRGDLQKAISKYHNGYQSVAEKLGLEYRKKRHGYWFDFSNLERELLACIERSGTPGVMPTKVELEKAEQGVIAWAIAQHGGFPEVAKKLNLKLSYERRPRNYWKNPDNLKREIFAVAKQLGDSKVLPTYEELTQIGRKDLIYAIADNGGWPSVARRFGLTYSKKHINPSDYF